MRTGLMRRSRLLIVFLAIFAILASSTPTELSFAQDTGETVTNTTTEVRTEVVDEATTDEATDESEATESPEGELDAVTEAEGAELDAAPAEEGAELEAIQPALPYGYTPPAGLSELSASELESLGFPAQTQGEIGLDVVLSPERIRAGELITYTYVFTNNTGTAVSNFLIRARWTNFKRTNTSGIYQYCKFQNCDPTVINDPQFTTPGIQVTRGDTSDTEIVYTVGSTINPGSSGRFSVVLASRVDTFPVTTKAPKRPAGSAQLQRQANSPVISEDTATSLVTGPVFVLTKAITSSATKVYVGETVEFTITLGNATDPKDIIDGRTRTDAIPATNIVLTDVFPLGSTYISSEGPVQATVNNDTKTLTWNIPSQLNPGATPLTFKVRFQKLDVNTQCGKLTNGTYKVTSSEMPIQTGITRYTISGKGVTAAVQVPMVIKSIKADPGSPIYGTETTLTIQVQNFWNQPITNAKLNYIIQSNAFYVPGKANPPTATAPSGAEKGGTLSWNFNMPAGSATVPTTQNFTFTIRGDYSKTVNTGTGSAQVIAPAGVPTACIKALNGLAKFQPRLTVSKYADPELTPNENGELVIGRGDTLMFIIEVENKGVAEADDVIIEDILPLKAGTAWSYVRNSALLNGQAYEPDPGDIQDGLGGKITWRNITIPAGEKATLVFEIVIDGNEFVEYCNTAVVARGDEATSAKNAKVCLKINPKFSMTKTVSRTTVNGNDPNDNREVEFTISVTNQEAGQSYQIGLYDSMGHFEFVRQLEGPSNSDLVPDQGNDREWPLMTLGPGQSYTVRFVAKLSPAKCERKVATNELLFRFKPSQGGSAYLVESVPATAVKVTFTCGTNEISYSKAVSAPIVGLGDKFNYTLNVKNENTTAEMKNIEIIDVLPSGFSYVGLAASSKIKDQPQITTRSDGRVSLLWKATSLAANQSTSVTFIAQSGEIVGTFDNWMRASADELKGVKGCVADAQNQNPTCSGYITVTDEGEERVYATRSVKVEPLHTLEPALDDESCANPNDIRFYTVSMLNTNSHSYTNTTVTTTIPLGLHFLRSVRNTPAPEILPQANGDTILVWKNLTVEAKPKDLPAAQLVLEVELRVGQTWGTMQPKVVANSPDGSIPQKDGSLDPTVTVCVEQPSVALDASVDSTDLNKEFIYSVSLVNTEEAPITLSLEDQLADGVEFVRIQEGAAPNSREGGKLVWTNVEIPAATENGPGLKTIKFVVKFTKGEEDSTINNTIEVTESSSPVDDTYNTVGVKIFSKLYVYLPMVDNAPQP